MSGLGVYFKQLRKSKGFTLRDVAEKAECSHAFLSQIETGARRPSYKLLLSLTKVLGADINRVLDIAFCTEKVENSKVEIDILGVLNEGFVRYKDRTLSSVEVEKVKKMLELILD